MKFSETTPRQNNTGLGLCCETITRAEEATGFMALSHALAMNGNPHVVLMRIFHSKREYSICWGYPPDSERHGVGETGSWDTPISKSALINCIEKRKRVIISDIENDPDALYLRDFANKKGIYAVLLEPFVIDDEVKLVAVFDLVRPDTDGFTEFRIAAHMDVFRDTVVSTMLPALSSTPDYTARKTIREVLAEVRHRLFNKFTTIGGWSRRLTVKLDNFFPVIEEKIIVLKNMLDNWEHRPPAKSEIQRASSLLETIKKEHSEFKKSATIAANIITADVGSLEANGNSYTQLISLFLGQCAPKPKPLENCFNFLKQKGGYSLSLDDLIREVTVDAALLETLLFEFDGIISRRGMEPKGSISVKAGKDFLEFNLVSDAFKPEIPDEKEIVGILHNVVEKYHGQMEMSHGLCFFALPY